MTMNRSAAPGPVVPVLVYDDIGKAIKWLCETLITTQSPFMATARRSKHYPRSAQYSRPCKKQFPITNSSVAVRGCSYLGIRAVNIGARQLGSERRANAVDVDYDQKAIYQAIKEHLSDTRKKGNKLHGDGSAGPRIEKKRLAY